MHSFWTLYGACPAEGADVRTHHPQAMHMVWGETGLARFTSNRLKVHNTSYMDIFVAPHHHMRPHQPDNARR